MSISSKYDGYLRNTKKKRQEMSAEQIRDRIGQSFFTCMSGFPESMAIDLYQYVCDDFDRRRDENAVWDLAEKLRRVVELFDENYEVAEDDFSDADWETIRQCVDDYALELDTDLITYIMRFIIRRGLIA